MALGSWTHGARVIGKLAFGLIHEYRIFSSILMTLCEFYVWWVLTLKPTRLPASILNHLHWLNKMQGALNCLMLVQTMGSSIKPFFSPSYLLVMQVPSLSPYWQIKILNCSFNYWRVDIDFNWCVCIKEEFAFHYVTLIDLKGVLNTDKHSRIDMTMAV